MEEGLTTVSGSFGRFLDDETVQYERIFPHPIERVWRAITDPVEVKGSLFAISIELRRGGAWTTSGEGDWSGEVTAVDPPRLLRCQHAAHMPGGVAGYFQYELAPVAGGTRMLFTEHFPGIAGGLARDPDGVAGGWHEIFDSLTEWLDGGPVGARLAETDLGQIAKAWAGSMVRGSEFDQAAADRYVLDLRREEASTTLNREYRRRAGAHRGEAPLARFLDRYTIEYIRTYPHPIERVWGAIADPVQMSAWFAPIAIDPRLGGEYLALWGKPGEPNDFKGVITILAPPRLLRFGGPEAHGPDGYWQFTLDPVPGGTRVIFVQSSPPGVWRNTFGWPADPPEHPAGALNPWRPGTLSGWHRSLDHLGELMDGGPLRDLGDEAPLRERYRQLMRETQP
ncbi:MAG TPA: SRPBCC domain-containing protein [Caulobacteraceae bacterium]|jgi:uncharacterized protein YndB with AHSA1/START domain